MSIFAIKNRLRLVSLNFYYKNKIKQYYDYISNKLNQYLIEQLPNSSNFSCLLAFCLVILQISFF